MQTIEHVEQNNRSVQAIETIAEQHESSVVKRGIPLRLSRRICMRSWTRYRALLPRTIKRDKDDVLESALSMITRIIFNIKSVHKEDVQGRQSIEIDDVPARLLNL
ncbi:hypothetical protein [Paenibacillus illinoisensis]|uniref:hypothetical protein n=1 Tax=Paenibacillus illinoisensis TaxID=59845 RepID=UPI001C8D02B0|nr:hypothetical protein [Paenibacillus illinoisensis]MBY0217086.1 hypothetical protein [Paenibacillus illinoisensis]